MDEPLKKLGSVCLLIGDEITRLSDALKAFTDALVANAVGIEPEAETRDDDKCDTIADLRKRLEEMYKLYAMGEFADLAEESVDIPPPRKIPRPPKRIYPVNRVNFAANKPHRRARSNCRIIKNR